MQKSRAVAENQMPQTTHFRPNSLLAETFTDQTKETTLEKEKKNKMY